MPGLLMMTATLIFVGALVVIAGQGWVLLQVRGQQGRLDGRIDDLALRLTSRAASSAARERDKQVNPLASEAAPTFDLAVLGGGRVTLDALLAPAKPLLLVFAEPRCGPCYELLPDIAGWQRVYGNRLTVALVSAGTPESNQAMTAEYAISQVLLQTDSEVVEAYGLYQAPAAVLVQPDGRISAGPRYGARGVRQLVAETLGLALPEAPKRAAQTAGIGEAPPPFRRPDLAGNVVDLATFRGSPTLMLFWSPGCSHCQEVLPDIKAFEQTPGRTQMVVVSRGPIALNQEAGLASTMVLDDDQSIAQGLGASGTPAAVLLDSYGRVATPVARGASGVRTALQALQALAAPASAAD